MRTVTVTSIHGEQQGAVAAAFAARGWAVRGTTRAGGATPFGPAHAADLVTGRGLADAFAGTDTVAVTLPQDHRPGAMVEVARHVTAAAEAARVPLLVFNFATIVPDASGPLFDDFHRVAEILAASPVPVARIEPTAFMDNLVAPWLRGAIDAGALPYPPVPAEVRVAWVSHATLGAAMAAAAERGPGRWRFGGPEALTGAETAAALARVAGHPVAFAPPPLQAFAEGLDAVFGPPAGERIASLYAHLHHHPAAFSPGTTDLDALGVPAETLDAFLRRRWRVEAPPLVATA